MTPVPAGTPTGRRTWLDPDYSMTRFAGRLGSGG
jgi:hypothetical protein